MNKWCILLSIRLKIIAVIIEHYNRNEFIIFSTPSRIKNIILPVKDQMDAITNSHLIGLFFSHFTCADTANAEYYYEIRTNYISNVHNELWLLFG